VKTALYMAQSVNGLIAREDYREDFLSDENWRVFIGFAQEFGCFIVSRKTYEIVSNWKGYSFESLNAKKIIVSRKIHAPHSDNYYPATSPIDALKKARTLGFKQVLLVGGGTLNSAFLKKGLVDEIILDIEPFALGKGIPVFSEEGFENKLKLLQVKKLKGGIVQLRYKVIK